MRNYSGFTKLGILLCSVVILLILINWYTGFINSTMTVGASAICLSSSIIVLFAMINTSNRKKN